MKQRFTVKNSSKGSQNFEQDNTAVKRNETRVALVMMVKVIQICQRYILLFLSCIVTVIVAKIIQICQKLMFSFSGPNDGGERQEDRSRERISDPHECLPHSCAREGNKIRNKISFASIYNVSLTSLTLQLYVVSCCCLV